MLNYDLLVNDLFLIAGPNVIESEEHCSMMAKKIKQITDELKITYIFKASFDKANRTSFDSYRGLGIEKGLRILQKVKQDVNVPIITDIHESYQAEIVARVADVIQIPAFMCRQTDLLKAAAETGKIIHVKKGQFCSPETMLKCAEKIRHFGNDKVIICERGSMYGYHDLVVDPRNLVLMRDKQHLVTMDITHSLQQPSRVNSDGSVCSGGIRHLIPTIARMSVAVGINGIFMEVHNRPDKSPCDAPTQWPLDKLTHLLSELITINNVTKGKITHYIT